MTQYLVKNILDISAPASHREVALTHAEIYLPLGIYTVRQHVAAGARQLSYHRVTLPRPGRAEHPSCSGDVWVLPNFPRSRMKQ